MATLLELIAKTKVQAKDAQISRQAPRVQAPRVQAPRVQAPKAQASGKQARAGSFKSCREITVRDANDETYRVMAHDSGVPGLFVYMNYGFAMIASSPSGYILNEDFGFQSLEDAMAVAHILAQRNPSINWSSKKLLDNRYIGGPAWLAEIASAEASL